METFSNTQADNDLAGLSRPHSLFNERNTVFWDERRRLRNELLENRLVALAACTLQDNALRGPNSFANVKDYTHYLIEAHMEVEEILGAARIDFARKGGSASKADELNRAILEIVRNRPDITQNQLLHALKKRPSLAFRVDDEAKILAGDASQLHWVEMDGTECSGSFKGLKDRLSRAKKKIYSR